MSYLSSTWSNTVLATTNSSAESSSSSSAESSSSSSAESSSSSSVESSSSTSSGNTLIVTNSNDSGIGSLRQAISDAVDGDTITFDSSLSGAIIALQSQLEIEKSINIDASSLAQKIILDGGDTYDGTTVTTHTGCRVIYVNGDLPVSLNNLVIQHGYGNGVFNPSGGTLTITNCTISGNTASSSYSTYGGGISNYGTLTITNSTISGNTASSSSFSYGGGVFNGGTLTITNSTISGNTASSSSKSSYGGGIYNDGTLTITNSAISGNTASSSSSSYGGGVYNSSGGTLTITNSTISGNTAPSSSSTQISYGGGIYNSSGGTLTITNSTISGNSTSSSSYSTYGGGVFNDGTLTITNSTISGNTASAPNHPYGGGVYCTNASASNLYNTIIANNTARNGADVFNSSGTINAYNTLSTFTSWSNKSADGVTNYVYNSSLPLFTDAANNDFTLALNSQAIGKGNNSYVATDTDLAGNTRIQGTNVDLGAYESEPLSDITFSNDTPHVGTPISVDSTVPAGINVSYQWLWGIEAGDENIDGATSQSYTPTISQAGGVTPYLKCKVTDDNDTGSFVVKRTTNMISSTQLSTPTVTSAAATSETTAYITFTGSDYATGYQIRYSTSSSLSDITPVSCTSNSTLTQLAVNTTYYYQLRAVNEEPTLASDWTEVASFTTLKITITSISLTANTIAVNENITANTQPTGSTASYQWYRETTYESNEFISITGATQALYTAVTEDALVRLKCIATGIGNYDGTVEIITNKVKAVLTNLSLMSDGQDLTDAASTAYPTVGIAITPVISPTGATVTYSWAADTTDNTTFTQADTYRPITGNLGKYVYCRASSNTSDYSGNILARSIQTVVDLVTSATISRESIYEGELGVSEPLTMNVTPSTASGTYTWYRSNHGDQETWTVIADATNKSYTTVMGDVGCFVKCIFTGNGNYSGTVNAVTNTIIHGTVSSVTISPASPEYLPSTDPNYAAGVSNTLTVVLVPQDATVSYEWHKKQTGGSFTLINGATTSSYNLTINDIGCSFYCRTIGTGDYTGIRVSNITANTTTPIYVSLTAEPLAVGTTIQPIVSPADAIGLTYAWYRVWTEDNSNVETPCNSTDSTYTITTADIRYNLRCKVTGTGNYTGTDVTATTADTVPTYTLTAPANLTSIPSYEYMVLKCDPVTGATTYAWECEDLSNNWVDIMTSAHTMISFTYSLPAISSPHIDHKFRVKATGRDGYETESAYTTITKYKPIYSAQVYSLSHISHTDNTIVVSTTYEPNYGTLNIYVSTSQNETGTLAYSYNRAPSWTSTTTRTGGSLTSNSILTVDLNAQTATLQLSNYVFDILGHSAISTDLDDWLRWDVTNAPCQTNSAITATIIYNGYSGGSLSIVNGSTTLYVANLSAISTDSPSNTFHPIINATLNNLTPNTAYYIHSQYAGNWDYLPSGSSSILTQVTDKSTQNAPNASLFTFLRSGDALNADSATGVFIGTQLSNTEVRYYIAGTTDEGYLVNLSSMQPSAIYGSYDYGCIIDDSQYDATKLYTFEVRFRETSTHYASPYTRIQSNVSLPKKVGIPTVYNILTNPWSVDLSIVSYSETNHSISQEESSFSLRYSLNEDMTNYTEITDLPFFVADRFYGIVYGIVGEVINHITGLLEDRTYYYQLKSCVTAPGQNEAFIYDNSNWSDVDSFITPQSDAPTVTLKGLPIYNVTQRGNGAKGENYKWIDPGVNVSDTEDTSLSSNNVLISVYYYNEEDSSSSSDSTDNRIYYRQAEDYTSEPIDLTIAGHHVIEYTVSDITFDSAHSGGKTATITRQVIVSPSNGPTVTLAGSWITTLEMNEAYIEEGAYFQDPLRGNYPITPDITREQDSSSDSSSSSNSSLTNQDILHIEILKVTTFNNQLPNCQGDIVDSINSAEAAIYLIKYRAEDIAGNYGYAYRIVFIVSTDSPDVVLNGGESVEFQAYYDPEDLNDIYWIDPGIAAKDKNGNAITNVGFSPNSIYTLIHSTRGVPVSAIDHRLGCTYIVYYLAIDSNKNAACVTRIVKITSTALTITAVGDPVYGIMLGQTFTPPGYICNLPSLLSSSVRLVTNINFNRTGRFYCYYSATDLFGAVVRSVSQLLYITHPLAPKIRIAGVNPITARRSDKTGRVTLLDPGYNVIIYEQPETGSDTTKKIVTSENFDENNIINSVIHITDSQNKEIFGLTYETSDDFEYHTISFTDPIGDYATAQYTCSYKPDNIVYDAIPQKRLIKIEDYADDTEDSSSSYDDTEDSSSSYDNSGISSDDSSFFESSSMTSEPKPHDNENWPRQLSVPAKFNVILHENNTITISFTQFNAPIYYELNYCYGHGDNFESISVTNVQSGQQLILPAGSLTYRFKLRAFGDDILFSSYSSSESEVPYGYITSDWTEDIVLEAHDQLSTPIIASAQSDQPDRATIKYSPSYQATNYNVQMETSNKENSVTQDIQADNL